jgi:hypothetical protein
MRLFKAARSKSSPARSPGSLFPASDPVGEDDADDDAGDNFDIAIARLLAIDQGDTVEVGIKQVKKEVANLAEAAARFRQRSRQVLEKERKRRVSAERSLNRHTWRPAVLSMDSPAKGISSPPISEGSVSLGHVAVGGWEDAEEEATLLREELKGMSEEFVTAETKAESLRVSLETLMNQEAKAEGLKSALTDLINKERRAEQFREENIRQIEGKASRMECELKSVKEQLRKSEEKYMSLCLEHETLSGTLKAAGTQLGAHAHEDRAKSIGILQSYMLEQVRTRPTFISHCIPYFNY